MAAGGGAATTHVGDVEEDASQLLFPKGAELRRTRDHGLYLRLRF